MVCLGLGVAASAGLLLSTVRQLLLVQAEDVMHKLVLLTCLDHPAPEQHTQKAQTVRRDKTCLAMPAD